MSNFDRLRAVGAVSLEEGARETRDKLDHTLQAYGRLEQRLNDVKRERTLYRDALKEIALWDFGKWTPSADEALMVKHAAAALRDAA